MNKKTKKAQDTSIRKERENNIIYPTDNEKKCQIPWKTEITKTDTRWLALYIQKKLSLPLIAMLKQITLGSESLNDDKLHTCVCVCV